MKGSILHLGHHFSWAFALGPLPSPPSVARRVYSSFFEITRLGIQAVIVAFRIGMHVHRKTTILGHSQPGSWSLVISAIQEESVAEVLTDYCADNVSDILSEYGVPSPPF